MLYEFAGLALAAGVITGPFSCTCTIRSIAPHERDTESAYPIFNFLTHTFIDRDGIIRSIVLEDMDTEQAVAEATRLLATSVSKPATDAESAG